MFYIIILLIGFIILGIGMILDSYNMENIWIQYLIPIMIVLFVVFGYFKLLN